MSAKNRFFEEQKRIGRIAEDTVMALFETELYPGCHIERAIEDCKEYDFIMNDTYYECKRSPQTHRYGNIPVEVEQNKKESGLMTSEATRWVFVCDLPNKTCEIYDVPVTFLTYLVAERQKNHEAPFICNHESLTGTTRCYLFHRSLFSLYSLGVFPFAFSKIVSRV